MTDPEVELSIRESMYWKSEVEGVLANIFYWLAMFKSRSSPGNYVLRILNEYADRLADLGWHGSRIPF